MRVRRSFAFIDLAGFTSFTEAHGDEEAVALLGSFRWHVREVAARRGVRIAKWLGDGAMLVSVDERPLVESVLEVERRVDGGEAPLVIRAGMSTGLVILMEGDDYIGHPVNLAARLGQEAQRHEILATPELVPAVPPWASVQPLDPVRLRGFHELVPVVNVTWGDCREEERELDPICAMEIARDAAVEHRVAEDGERVLFCSASCAEVWDQGRSRGADGRPRQRTG